MKPLFIFSLLLFSNSAFAMESKRLEFNNGATLIVEVASELNDRRKGLMHRTELAENHGMLFVFDYSMPLGFWNKNTFIALDLAMFDENKKLKEIHHIEPVSLLEQNPKISSYEGRCLCKYALEVNKGWLEKNKVSSGNTFTLNSL